MASGPLSGVKVLEFTQIIAGPFCGMHLADMGADVIKFEPIEGEPWRLFAELVPKESRTFASLNRGKRGMAMDMNKTEAQEAIHRMVKDADVVVINYRPGVAQKLRIDYDTLAAINPRLIYCENTAFGRKGPLSSRGGYDIVIQAMTGLMAGEAKVEGGVPTAMYPAPADFATGIQMANSISAALYYREKTGQGQRIDCTLMGTAMITQTSQFTWIDAWDQEILPAMLSDIKDARDQQKSFTEQVAVHNTYRPAASGNIYYRVYQTRDGFIAIGALSQSLRVKVLAATGLKDIRFTPDGGFDMAPPGWETAGPKLVQEAEDLFRTKTSDEWLKILEQNGVPAGPLFFIEELFGHPQTIENGLEVELDHPILGHMRMIGPPFQMTKSPLQAQGPSPILGEHNDEILASVGYSADQIEAMRAAGAIR